MMNNRNTEIVNAVRDFWMVHSEEEALEIYDEIVGLELE